MRQNCHSKPSVPSLAPIPGFTEHHAAGLVQPLASRRRGRCRRRGRRLGRAELAVAAYHDGVVVAAGSAATVVHASDALHKAQHDDDLARHHHPRPIALLALAPKLKR